MKIFLLLIFVCWLGTFSTFSQGTILWNENVNGPLGNSPATATALGPMTIGTNTVIGMSGVEPVEGGWAVSPDFFYINVPASAQISEVFFTVDRRTWVWLGDGTWGNQIGFVDNPTSGTLFPQMGLQNMASGNYSMYVANFDRQSFPTIANYQLDFVVAAIPEPSTWALFALGSACLWSCARRRWK